MTPKPLRAAFITFASALSAGPGIASAAPLLVDFSIAGRPDSVAPGYEQWFFPDQKSDMKSFGAVTVKVSQVGTVGTGLHAAWWKGAAVDGARMSADGITVAGGDAGGKIELRLRDLAPGPHRFTGYFNVTDGKQEQHRAPLVISLDGVPVVTGVVPSFRVASDDDAQSASFAFTASDGKDVVILIEPDPTARAADVRNVALCGFELDTADPKLQAGKPFPANRDEHVDADRGSLTLRWRAAASAVAQRIYVGHSPEAVAAAKPHSPEDRGVVTTSEFELGGLKTDQELFWRVDEIDANDRVTSGDVWRFRPRRLAFPGAEGYGRFARGGRGGRVIEVTTLADAGPGSFRAAVEAAGPRTVVFAVSGLITLESRLIAKNSYLTVAGQTAPGKGITIRKYGFGLSGANDTVVRQIRVRPGNIAGITLDGMGMQGSDHSIIDHVSISWTIDEAFSSRSARNITLQRALISEALNVAGHKNYKPGTQHGYAASIGGMVGSFHHNLLANNSGRNWSLAGGIDGTGRHTGWLDLRNNVVFNWNNRATDGGAAKVNFVGNYYKPGPATKYLKFLNPQLEGVKAFGPQIYFVAGNVLEGIAGPDNQAAGMTKPAPDAEFMSETPLFEADVTTQSARAAYKCVLSDVGCTQPAFDAHDRRMVAETLSGKVAYRGSKSGLPGLPDSQDDVGGWEDYPAITRPASWDRDHDGMPDWWERLHGLDPSSPVGDYTEDNADPDGDGFTQLEDYLNWLAAPHADVAVNGAIEIDLSELTRGFTASPSYVINATVHGEAVLLNDHRLRFAPTPGFAGLASVSFTVTDAEGDSMQRSIGLHVQ